MSDHTTPVTSYPGYYPQDPVPTDARGAGNRGWSCVGFVIALIIIGIVLQLPGMLSGTIIYMGGPFSLLTTWGLLLAPVIIIIVAFRWITSHRDSTDVQ